MMPPDHTFPFWKVVGLHRIPRTHGSRTREAGYTRGLGYPSIFTCNAISTIILRDSSGSEIGSDEDIDEYLLTLPVDQGRAPQNEVLEAMTHDLEIDADEVVDATPTPKQLRDGGHTNVDVLVEINLGTDEDPKPTYVSALLSLQERRQN